MKGWKFLAFIIVSLLLFPLISANEVCKETTGKTYTLYKKTVIIFGKLHIKDTFTTPPDCHKISVNAKVGPYFTGGVGVLIRSEGHRGAHTIWGTGLYIFGRFVWPALRVFYEYWFIPGLQYVEISGTGFGIVTFWINGSSAKTLYVGGTGPNNYTSIQNAIDDAYPGDTIFVYSGIYRENIDIGFKKDIKVIGEDKYTTIIDGGGNGSVIKLSHYSCPTINVTIEGFTIRNGSYGILCDGDYNIIRNCIIYDNEVGIYCRGEHNVITQCNIQNNGYGIKMAASSNHIYHNNFMENEINAYDTKRNLWDNGYPSGGNYWDDFDSPEEGAYDNNSDGIVDTPYHIPGGENMDRYPLIHLYQLETRKNEKLRQIPHFH